MVDGMAQHTRFIAVMPRPQKGKERGFPREDAMITQKQAEGAAA
jgi:hypothetical protein